METIRNHVNGAIENRYFFDGNVCSSSKGFAQIDTSQDASYFGIWANPEKLMIVSYCEGELTVQIADNEAEFVQEVLKIKQWNEEYGHEFYGIDPGFNDGLKSSFERMGLSHLLH